MAANDECGALAGSDSFSNLWERTVGEYGSQTFLVFGSDFQRVEWSYSDFDEIVQRVAQGLLARGVAPGDYVHICLANSPAFVAIWLAVARIGACMLPADPEASVRDLRRQFRRMKPVLGVCARSRSDIYREGSLGSGISVIELEESATDLRLDSPLLSEEGSAMALPSMPVPQSTMAVMFTSGTTSEPKGVELTQANYEYVGVTMARAAGLTCGHRWFVSLPLFHANAQFYCFASAIAVGASVALIARFSASKWVAQARALNVTHASLFAGPMRMILARTSPDQPPADLEHMWFAQNVTARQHSDFASLIGTLPRQVYGLTETTAVVTFDQSKPPVHDSIGAVICPRQATLLNPRSLLPVPVGEPGMIAVSGERGKDLFLGYHNDIETTSQAFFTDEEGVEWFLTGDLAVEDEFGAWRFQGRVDDVIKVSGENVSLTELESTISEAPGVLEAAVLPIPDLVRDVVPVAYVVPTDSAQAPTADELTEWSKNNITPAARPRAWYIVDSLPRTSVGKLKRFELQRKHS